MFASNPGSSTASSTGLTTHIVPHAESVKDDLQRFVPRQYCFLPDVGHYVPVIFTESSTTIKEDPMENQDVIIPPSISNEAACESQEIRTGPPNSELHNLEKEYKLEQDEIKEIIDCHMADEDFVLAESLQEDNFQDVIVPPSISNEAACESQEISIGPPNSELHNLEMEYKIKQDEIKEIIDCHMADEDFVLAESLQEDNFQVDVADQHGEQGMLQLPRTRTNPEQQDETYDLATNPEAAKMVQTEYFCHTYHGKEPVYHQCDGYYYLLSQKGAECDSMACAFSKKCLGRASMHTNPSERSKKFLRIIVAHNHPPDYNWIKFMEVKGKILDRCRSETTSLTQIAKEEMERLQPEIKTSEIMGKFLQQTMYRMRQYKDAKNIFVPSNVLHYGEFLETNQRFGNSRANKPFYRATVKDEADNAAVIFISETLSEILPQTSHVQVDSTWRIMPSSPACHHLLIIAPVYHYVVLPTIFVVMEKRSEILYQMVFTFLKQTFSQWTPDVFTTDYNGLLHNVISQLWPAAAVVGSWCHTANCMAVKMNHLRHLESIWTNKDANLVFKKCQALPFLPPEKVQEGYEHIVDFADRTGTLKNLVVFLNYVHRVWLKGIGAECFSVYRQEKRTFNDIEVFHQKLKNHLKNPPHTIWLFTDGIRMMEFEAVSAFTKLEKKLCKGFPVRKGPKVILSRISIIKLTTDLVHGVISVEEFLRGVSQEIEFYHNMVYNVLNNDDCDDEILEELKVSRLPPDAPKPRRKRVKKKKRHGRP